MSRRMFEIVVVLAVAGVWIYLRTVLQGTPADLGCYIDAVRAFQSGGAVYPAPESMTPASPGRPFIYPPGVLYYFAPMGWFSAKVVSAVDILLHLTVLLVVCRTAANTANRPDTWPLLFAASIGFAPVFFDFQFGNINTYLLGALVAAGWATAQEHRRHHLVIALFAGVICSIKFTWLAALGVTIIAARRWPLAAAAAVGASLTGLLSLTEWELVLKWQETMLVQQTLQVNDAEKLNELLWVLAPFFVFWAGCLWKLVQRQDPRVWLLASTMPMVLPGTSHSTPLVMIPVLIWLVVRRAESRAAVLAAVVLLLLVPWAVYWWSWAGWDVFFLLLHAAVCVAFLRDSRSDDP